MSRERELFWRSLIEAFDLRLRAYMRRAGIVEREANETIWDVRAEAVDFVVWDAFGNWGLGNLTVTWCGQYAC